ncbi:uncharacterized protein LOC107043145 [Diachasma alloeum]|uniref:uncharacterized protein LOC107043145 n=1 Tax=Diachasma alloeum TaxID=454923 RepID=UPI0007381182|nr:uncharacterized protein LOC107043145 [Diachasma alloeum]
MLRNVEIKAVLRNAVAAHARAKELSHSDGTIIHQTDTFFKTPQGRLKLRCFENGTGVLVYYERSDTQGPKLSDYSLVDLATEKSCDELKKILGKVNGTSGVVEKTRHLYMVGQSRVHIDRVTGLGDFLEIEVVLEDHQSVEEGQVICNDLLAKLGISNDDLLAKSYVDLLQEKQSRE